MHYKVIIQKVVKDCFLQTKSKGIPLEKYQEQLLVLWLE